MAFMYGMESNKKVIFISAWKIYTFNIPTIYRRLIAQSTPRLKVER